MECPKCKANTKVDSTRSDKGQTYRKRVCKDCGYVFWTVEQKLAATFGRNAMSKIHYARYKKVAEAEP